MTPDQVQAAAAVATFLAALMAVWAAFRAPKLAAEFAEELRVRHSALDENRRLKMLVFTTLMENRGSILAANSISAINLIDLVFVDSQDVRNARKDFMAAVEAKPYVNASAVERYFGLTHTVARDIGLNDQIAISDIRSVYFPLAHEEQAELDFLERQQRLSLLRKSSSSVSDPQ